MIVSVESCARFSLKRSAERSAATQYSNLDPAFSEHLFFYGRHKRELLETIHRAARVTLPECSELAAWKRAAFLSLRYRRNPLAMIQNQSNRPVHDRAHVLSVAPGGHDQLVEVPATARLMVRPWRFERRWSTRATPGRYLVTSFAPPAASTLPPLPPRPAPPRP